MKLIRLMLLYGFFSIVPLFCADGADTAGQTIQAAVAQQIIDEVQQLATNTQNSVHMFHQTNPWAYLEKTLVDDPEYNASHEGKINGDNFMKAWIAFFAAGIAADLLLDLKGFGVGIGLWGGIIPALIIGAATKKERNFIREALDAFFKNYDATLIPQELAATFDILHKKYQQDKEAFWHEVFQILDEVRGLIYKQNPSKYYPPVVNVMVYR